MPGKNMPSVVVDTNVLISSLIGQRLNVLLVLIKKNRFELIFSNETFDELFFVLTRPKFMRYFSSKDITEFRELLKLQSSFIDKTEEIHICRDPKDNKFLECALSAHADFIISGDHDLLVLNPFREIPIITPNEFISQLRL